MGMAIAKRVWKFQRYGLIIEYAQRRSFLFPPFSLIFHLYVFVRWLLSLCSCTKIRAKTCEAGLKQHIPMTDQIVDQLRELESNSLIKLVRMRKQQKEAESHDHGFDNNNSMHPVSKGDAEKKFGVQQLRMMEEVKGALERNENRKTETIQRPSDIQLFVERELEFKREKEELEERLASTVNRLDELEKKCNQNEAEEEEMRKSVKQRDDEIKRLQTDNKIYLQEIVKKKKQIMEQQRRIAELEDEPNETSSVSGIEN